MAERWFVEATGFPSNFRIRARCQQHAAAFGVRNSSWEKDLTEKTKQEIFDEVLLEEVHDS
jgi:hypothetical protein